MSIATGPDAARTSVVRGTVAETRIGPQGNVAFAGRSYVRTRPPGETATSNLRMTSPVIKRQHYLPCTLLRGFASCAEGDESYAYYLRRTAAPFETNIKNIAVEGYFNGRPDESDLEKELSALEGPFGLMLQELRSSGVVREELRRPIAEFVAHLVVRTKHLRDGFTEGMVEVTRSIERYARAPESRARLERLLLARMVKEPDIKHSLARLPQAQRIAATHAIRKHIATLDFPGFMQAVLAQVREQGDLAAKARRAHLDGLAKGLVARADILSPLRWRVVADDPASFVLGDVGVIVCFGPGGSYTHAILKTDCPEVVLLPISSSRLIVGHRADTLPAIDAEAINRQMAELSREFLVASRCGSRERGYQALLGTRAALMAPEEIDALDIGRLFDEQ